MPLLTKVNEIMTKSVFTVDIEDTVLKADEIMKEEKIKHVPVLEGTKIVGIINDRKIMEYSLRQLYDAGQNYGDMGYNKITDFEKLMMPIAHVVYPEDSVAKAVKLMAKHRLDCLPVVDWDMNLEGILTHTDILFFMYNQLTENEK